MTGPAELELEVRTRSADRSILPMRISRATIDANSTLSPLARGELCVRDYVAPALRPLQSSLRGRRAEPGSWYRNRSWDVIYGSSSRIALSNSTLGWLRLGMVARNAASSSNCDRLLRLRGRRDARDGPAMAGDDDLFPRLDLVEQFARAAPLPVQG